MPKARVMQNGNHNGVGPVSPHSYNLRSNPGALYALEDSRPARERRSSGQNNIQEPVQPVPIDPPPVPINDNNKVCWICYFDEAEDPLARWISPCSCRGSIKWIHANCFNDWCTTRVHVRRELQPLRCCQCRQLYTIKPSIPKTPKSYSDFFVPFGVVCLLVILVWYFLF